MHGKTSYAIFLSTLALFAALAAHAKEPAASERSAVLSAARDGNRAAYAKALERYNEALSAAFKPKAKPIRKPASTAIVASAQDSSVAGAQPIARPIAHKETNLPDDSKKVLASAEPKDAVMAALTPELRKSYQDCLKSGPAECCQPMIDSRAALPMSCVNRDIASDGSSNGTSSSSSNSAM